ncbi:hypothetical protein HDV00_011846 [Rhizophlyctis rosea]|nr:hypothetical protein HDV00_011846 [Rhizophlyctis rosea]
MTESIPTSATPWTTRTTSTFFTFTPYHVRANAVAFDHNSEHRTTTFNDNKTGSSLATCRRYANYFTTICGDYIFQFEGNDTRKARLHVSSVRNDSFKFRLAECHQLCFNERLLAHVSTNEDDINSVQLVRLSDQKLLNTYTTDRVIDTLKMSRFNLFICYHPSRRSLDPVDVLDFHGKYLYRINVPSTLVECRWDNQIVIDGGDAFTLLDPIEGTSRRMFVESTEEYYDSEEDDGEHISESEGTGKEWYSFTMMEYPTDDEGKRTGGRGVLKCYRRYLE